MAAFVDRVPVPGPAGNGGHGVSSVHREKYKPLGGPDGGNGGDGGDVVLEVDPSVHTLLDFHHRPHQKAGNGRPGAGSNRHGARGEDRVLRVPEGTVVSTPDGRQVADLMGAGPACGGARRAPWPAPPPAGGPPPSGAPPPGSSGRRAEGAVSAMRRWPPPAARPPASPCWASPARRSTRSSSSRASPTSGWS